MRRQLLIPIAVVLLAAVAMPLLAADKRRGDGHRFEDPFEHTARWDDPKRDEWQKPGLIWQMLGLEAGSSVADLGAGTGYLTRLFSLLAEEEGKVYAVDVEPKMLEYIRNRQDIPFDNVETILADPGDPKLPPASVDAVVILNTWHHLPDRTRYLRKLAPALRRGARVAVVDWRAGELPMGPPPEMKLSRDEVVAEFEKAGWELTSESVALPYQYLLLFRP